MKAGWRDAPLALRDSVVSNVLWQEILDSLFIAITTVQNLQPHLSTRWTRQTRLTNSQGAIQESWIARCSPRAPGFSREQYAKIGWTVILVTALATEPLTLKLKFIHISNQLILSCIYLMLNNGEGEGLKILEKKVD